MIDKKKYKLTVGNTTSAIGLIIGIYFVLNPGYEGWGYAFAYVIFIACTLYFLLDWLLQNVVPKHFYINITEVIIDIFILIWYFNM
ncbi:hypothetical protein BXY58_0696 [Epilithonimonas arachidiradicis]|uniref:Uncharacterized protein n=2 Tax=Epilithonimonas arachidiradicis TaxID=1617282 RepID=A0A420DDV4_9FLAO|nr:hypothetical protein BXY58_0696 [Epilithonimonas arachidiradicis]